MLTEDGAESGGRNKRRAKIGVGGTGLSSLLREASAVTLDAADGTIPKNQFVFDMKSIAAVTLDLSSAGLNLVLRNPVPKCSKYWLPLKCHMD